MSYEYPEVLHEVDGGLKRLADITKINTLPVTLLSAFVLKKMAARRSGVVVNISSSAAAKTLRFWAVYSATKKFMCWLTEILRKEYEHRGVTVQSVVPMMVATKMSKVRKSSLFVPSAEQFARSAVRTIGNVDETTGFWSHQLQHTVAFKLLPDFLFNRVSDSSSQATRARALKKKQQKAE